MSKLLEIIKTGWYVHFEVCMDGALWYTVTYGDPNNTIFESPKQYRFRIPLEDVAGGEFCATDDNVKYYMRWIRKQLEADAEQVAMIEQARVDWEKNNGRE